jgi:hypothetical protein
MYQMASTEEPLSLAAHLCLQLIEELKGEDDLNSPPSSEYGICHTFRDLLANTPLSAEEEISIRQEMKAEDITDVDEMEPFQVSVAVCLLATNPDAPPLPHTCALYLENFVQQAKKNAQLYVDRSRFVQKMLCQQAHALLNQAPRETYVRLDAECTVLSPPAHSQATLVKAMQFGIPVDQVNVSVHIAGESS